MGKVDVIRNIFLSSPEKSVSEVARTTGYNYATVRYAYNSLKSLPNKGVELSKKSIPLQSVEGMLDLTAVREQIMERYKFCRAAAEEKYPQLKNSDVWKNCEIVFRLRSTRAAGRATYSNRANTSVVDFNLLMAAIPVNNKNFIDDTVPHEVAHIVNRVVYHNGGHDNTWYKIMRDVYHIDATRTHNYSTAALCEAKGLKTFVWKCKCKEHAVLARKHINMLKTAGQEGVSTYRCNRCKSYVYFVGGNN